MKPSWRITLTLAAAGLLILPLVLRGNTVDVFRVQTTWNGVIERGSESNSLTEKVVITADDLVNLAQHRTLGTPVPKNEVLALLNDCATESAQLIIYDTAAGSNRVTVGALSNLTTATSHRKRTEETITQLTINDVSTVDSNGQTMGLTGGSFYYHGKISINATGCPTSFGGQLTGLLGTAFPSICSSNYSTNIFFTVLTNCVTNVVVMCETNIVAQPHGFLTNFPCTDAITVIIPRAPITTGRIGTLSVP